ncbi:hypothetical protein [Actinospongicola halichondriae]|uniref:hypothetical protein n=1 Tax=Actinospongicola halichondriae TaxID=3236844 RepID=UPI003D3F5536
MSDRVHGHRMTSVVGGVTVAVTAVGAVVTTTNVAPALAEPAAVDATAGAAAGGGVLQSCEAYFGFGKRAGGANVVEFDVADTNGEDGVDHAVPDDTGVVLVIEGEEGTVECTPTEITEQEWDEDDWYGGFLGDVPFPGPGHYAYPSVNLHQEVTDIGPVLSVAFRVAGIPDEHTLESPTGMHLLDDHFIDFDSADPDQRALDLIAADADASASAAFATAFAECWDDNPVADETDADLIAAVEALDDFIFGGDSEYSEADCDDVWFLRDWASHRLAVLDAAQYLETISLSTPEPESTSTTSTPTSTTSTSTPEDIDVSPAAEAVTSTPTFTG